MTTTSRERSPPRTTVRQRGAAYTSGTQLPWRFPLRVLSWPVGNSTGESLRNRNAELERGEHLLHPLDLGRLIDVDVGGELEHGLVLPGAIRAEQVLDHRDGARVVLDHEGQEQLVELGASCL